MNYCVILCTINEKKEAEKISEILLSERLCACCNIINSVTSVYEWEGKLQKDSEFLIIIKTKSELFEKVKNKIKELHSYEVPEIIALPIENGNSEYLNWINSQCGNKL